MNERFAHRDDREPAAARESRALAGATALAALALLLGAAAIAVATLLPSPAGACDHGLNEVGYLGISDLSCDCTTNFAMRSRDGKAQLSRVWIFRSEPVVGGVNPDGPSAGRLQKGDVLTAIDGALITTREGSQRFSEMQPGQSVRLTVRRDGREMPVVLRVGSICPEDLTGVFSLGDLVAPRVPPAPATEPVPAPAPTPGSDFVPPVSPEATPPMPPMRAPTPRAFRWSYRGMAPRSSETPSFRPEALPQGWLGIGLTCQDCGGQVGEGEKAPIWSFGTLPTISYVDPEGPSARAGLRRGDQLTHIDGVSLLSPEGGRRFGAVKPGQVVKWRLIREGSPKVIAVRAVPRPGDDAPDFGPLREQLRAIRDSKRQLESREMRDLMRKLSELDRNAPEVARAQKRLRYAGSVGGSDVEVRGLGNVVVDDSGDEVVIVTRDATIRIKPGGKIEKTPRPK